MFGEGGATPAHTNGGGGGGGGGGTHKLMFGRLRGQVSVCVFQVLIFLNNETKP